MCALRHIRNEHEADKRVVSASPGASPSGVLHSHLGMHAKQRRTRRDQLPAGQAILVTRHGHRRALACALAHVHDPTREPAVARWLPDVTGSLTRACHHSHLGMPSL